MYERKNASGQFVPAFIPWAQSATHPPSSPSLPPSPSSNLFFRRELRDIISRENKRKERNARRDQSRRAEIIREIGGGLRKKPVPDFTFREIRFACKSVNPRIRAQLPHSRARVSRSRVIYYIALSLAKLSRVRSRFFSARDSASERLNLFSRSIGDHLFRLDFPLFSLSLSTSRIIPV